MSRTPHKTVNIKPSIESALDEAHPGGYGVGGYGATGEGPQPAYAPSQPPPPPPIFEPLPDRLDATAGMPSVNDMVMDFGMAIRMMEMGYCVFREGWNGKNMWIALSGVGGSRGVHASEIWSKPAKDFAETQPGGIAVVLPCIIMKTAADELLMGWLASQSDMLAKDWRIKP